MPTESRGDASIREGLGAANLVVVGSSVLTIVATFLPWVIHEAIKTYPTFDGLQMADRNLLFSGVLTAILAIVAFGLATGLSRNERARIGEVALGVLVAGVGLTYVLAPGVAMGDGGQFVDFFGVVPTTGVYVTIAGGVGMVIGGLAGYYG